MRIAAQRRGTDASFDRSLVCSRSLIGPVPCALQSAICGSPAPGAHQYNGSSQIIIDSASLVNVRQAADW